MDLPEAIATVYSAFSGEERPHSLSVCPCCVGNSEVERLLTVPISQLTPSDLSGYAGSVMLTSGTEADFCYFLPRILELTVTGRFWWPDKEVVFSSLRLAKWNDWSLSKREALHALFHTAFREALRAGVDASEIDSWICALARADIDLRPYLTMLQDPAAIDLLASYHEWNSDELSDRRLSNAFWESEPAIEVVVSWFESEVVRAALLQHKQASDVDSR